ncbi:baseplate assembly protein [Perlucidibaca piscinae]|uniref:baseplate assembly protein n=1 Tax=Perlucidibaca piscinae TaxID=392589 RepID=UPI0003B6FC64|nr:baseplate J/gp47 family protein [Perlucidibaca piscinae]
MAGGAFTTVDLQRLAAPGVVESLDFESILNEMLQDLRARHPGFTATVESDPAYKILEVAAFREVLLRQRVNEAAKAVMLAFAEDTDLDHIGANLDVGRLLITEGDPEAIPPIEPIYESDEDFRARLQLSLEGITTAGSEGSYVFHALSADGDVKDASATSPAPGEVTIYVLSRSGDGAADSELLDAVGAALNAERVRPLTDLVTVMSAAIVPYTIEAELVMYPGPDAEVVRQAAEDAVTAYAESVRRIGYDVTMSGLYAALHQPGVQRVNLTEPMATLAIDDGEASNCTAITVTIAAGTDV